MITLSEGLPILLSSIIRIMLLLDANNIKVLSIVLLT